MAQSSVVAEGCNIMEGLMVTQQMICLVEDSAERRWLQSMKQIHSKSVNQQQVR